MGWIRLVFQNNTLTLSPGEKKVQKAAHNVEALYLTHRDKREESREAHSSEISAQSFAFSLWIIDKPSLSCFFSPSDPILSSLSICPMERTRLPAVTIPALVQFSLSSSTTPRIHPSTLAAVSDIKTTLVAIPPPI